MQLVAVGINHRTAPIAFRERFSPLAKRGAEIASVAHKTGIDETLVLSTCNRFEVYGAGAKADVDADALILLLQGLVDAPPAAGRHWYIREGEAAIAHLFRVAAGLDAMVVGETQVLGQLKMAYQSAWEAGTTGPILNRTLHRAFHAAKRVHTETGLGSQSRSVASVAASHARELVGDPSRSRALVVGTGETGTIAARALIRQGFARVAVAGRTAARTEAAALNSGAVAAPWATLSGELVASDVVIAATSAKRPVINAALFDPAALGRRPSPLYLIDLGTPRNVSPRLKGATGIALVTIDDLQAIAEEVLVSRRRESNRAEELVREEAGLFAAEFSGRRFAGTIAELSEKFSGIRTRELAHLFRLHPELSERQRRAIEAAGRSIVSKILSEPARYLTEGAYGDQERFLSADLLKRIFKLDGAQKP